MKHFLFVFTLFSLLISCADSPSSKVIPPKPFPSAKYSMISPDYNRLAINYWDKYIDSVKVFSKDTSLIGGITRDDFSNAYVRYVDLLQRVPKQTYIQAQKKLLKLIEKTAIEDSSSRVFESIVSISEAVLHGSNSNLRNEELYIPFLEELINSPVLETLLRDKYKIYLEDCMLNRIGSFANNFTFHTKYGTKDNLYNIQSDYTFLFFSNPGCNACLSIINALKDSPKIASLVKSKSLTVINMYLDSNLTEWFKYLDVYPEEWINAYDEEMSIIMNHLYSIPAIPSIYLLDKEKKVIYKDAHFTSVLNYLENID